MSFGDFTNKKVNSSLAMPSILLRKREDYANWKLKMRNYLLHKDLWEAVAGYPVGDVTSEDLKKKNDRKASTKICLTLEDAAIVHVRRAQTAAEAWNDLQDAFEDRSLGRRLALERKLYRLSFDEFNDLEKYLQAI